MKKLIYITLALLPLSLLAADFVIYPLTPPQISVVSGTVCPAPFKGVVSYIVQPITTWGYFTDPLSGSFSVTDTNRSDTKVQCIGYFGDVACNNTTVTFVPVSPKYRFSVYFTSTNNFPATTNYPLVLHGFLP